MYSNIYYESLKLTYYVTQSCKIIIETRLCHLRFDGISIFLLTGKVNCYFLGIMLTVLLCMGSQFTITWFCHI